MSWLAESKGVLRRVDWGYATRTAHVVAVATGAQGEGGGLMSDLDQNTIRKVAAVMTDGNRGFVACPHLMTEEELIRFLRIPEVSKAEDYGNVVANLKRMRGLPCIHISKQPLYPRDAICRWIERETSAMMN